MKTRYIWLVRKTFRALRHRRLRDRPWRRRLTKPLFDRQLWKPCRDSVASGAAFFLVGIRLWAVGKRHGYLTQCEYFRNRFDSPKLGYLLFPVLVLLLIPYLLVGVIAAGKFIQATTKGMFPEQFALTLPNGAPHPLSGGIPPELGGFAICAIVLSYVFAGGLRGAVWANVFQTVIFMITGVIAFWMISQKLGGLAAASQAVLDSEFARPRAARELLIAGMMPVVFIVAASAVSLVAVSLLTARPSDATLRKFF